MVIVGILLLIAAVAFGIDFVWKNDFRIADPVAFGQHLGVHDAAALFVVGAITGAVALLGLSLLIAGVRRKGTKAASRHRARREGQGVHQERDELRAENEELRGELQNERVDPGGRTIEDSPRR